MKFLALFLLGFLVSCQPMTVRQSTIPGASSGGDQENSLGDELWNNTWYRPLPVENVMTENVFSPDGTHTVRAYDPYMTTRVPAYDQNNTYEIIGPDRIKIDHGFYEEIYTAEFDGNGMRLCDSDNECAVFKNDPGIFY